MMNHYMIHESFNTSFYTKKFLSYNTDLIQIILGAWISNISMHNLLHSWFLNVYPVQIIGMRACARVCVSTPKAILTSGVM